MSRIIDIEKLISLLNSGWKNYISKHKCFLLDDFLSQEYERQQQNISNHTAMRKQYKDVIDDLFQIFRDRYPYIESLPDYAQEDKADISATCQKVKRLSVLFDGM